VRARAKTGACAGRSGVARAARARTQFLQVLRRRARVRRLRSRPAQRASATASIQTLQQPHCAPRTHRRAPSSGRRAPTSGRRAPPARRRRATACSCARQERTQRGVSARRARPMHERERAPGAPGLRPAAAPPRPPPMGFVSGACRRLLSIVHQPARTAQRGARRGGRGGSFSLSPRLPACCPGEPRPPKKQTKAQGGEKGARLAGGAGWRCAADNAAACAASGQC
jgi:hypothetical protein